MALARRRPERAASYARLKEIIRRESLLTGGNFQLASGASSSLFFDMKKTMFDPEGAALVGELLLDALGEEPVDYVGGLEMGAVPIVAAICVKSHPARPLRGFFVRKAPKGHGTNQLIDGQFADGARVAIVEDVTTTGGSAMKAVQAVRDRGATVERVITIVDRKEGAEANFQAAGIRLLALFEREDFLNN
jgi:orotate phosphoribosyltransferase